MSIESDSHTVRVVVGQQLIGIVYRLATGDWIAEAPDGACAQYSRKALAVDDLMKYSINQTPELEHSFNQV